MDMDDSDSEGSFNHSMSNGDDDGLLLQILELKESLLKQRAELSEESSEILKIDIAGVGENVELGDDGDNGIEEKPLNCSRFREENEIDVTPYFSADKVFDSKESLIKHCQDVGRSVGTVVVIKQHERPSSRRPNGRLIFGCERGGSYRKLETSKPAGSYKKRRTGTKKCGCPFQLNTLFLEGGKFKIDVVSGLHNHEAAESLVGHSYAGRLTKDELETVRTLMANGVKPRFILKEIKSTNKFNVSNSRAVYNACNKFRKQARGNLSIMQHTLKLAADHKYYHFHTKDERTNKVKSVFWAHPDSVNMMRCFPYVIVLDCTYKTNRYRMPLLEIVSQTSTHSTFNVAYVFMEREKYDNYVWALECLRTLLGSEEFPKVMVSDDEPALVKAIEKVFPTAERLLCTYHVECNLRKNCANEFYEVSEWVLFKKDWDELVVCRTEELFNKTWKEFQKKWVRYPIPISYVRTNLLPKKEHFASAWTNKIMHFGSTTSNRVEGAHSSLKQYLHTSLSSFPVVWNAIHNNIELQLTRLDGLFQKSKIIEFHHHKDDIFIYLRGVVSHCLLDMLSEELALQKTTNLDPKECGCITKYTHGVPCAHELVDYRRERKVIPFDSIHPFWKQLSRKPDDSKTVREFIDEQIDQFRSFYASSSITGQRVLRQKFTEMLKPYTASLNEPCHEGKRVKGRPRGSSNKKAKIDSSTRRDPSGFEFAQTQEEMLLSQSNVSKSKKVIVKKMRKADDRLLNLIPEEIRPLIQRVRDVPGDDNCGFHAIAVGLDLPTKTGWLTVRTNLTEELALNNDDDYKRCWGENEFERQVKALEHFSETPPDMEHWCNIPEHAMLAANYYQRVFVIIGPDRLGVMTIPPCFNPPYSNFADKVIGIAKISENHFGYVEFKQPLTALPPLSVEWNQTHSLDADGWEPLLEPLVKEWELVQPRFFTGGKHRF